jgi:hypothetical protein
MLKDHEPDRNIEELSDEEINSAIHYLEPDSQYPEPDSQCSGEHEEQNDRGSLAMAITFLILLFAAVGFVWFYR